MQKNASLVAIVAVHTAENEPSRRATATRTASPSRSVSALSGEVERRELAAEAAQARLRTEFALERTREDQKDAYTCTVLNTT